MAGRRKQRGAETELDSLVQSGQAGAYEALQLYRSRSARAKGKGDFATAISTAARGARAICPLYEAAGFELAVLLIELLVESDQDCTPENRSFVNEVEASFPAQSKLRIEFLTGAIKWTAKCGSRELGDPMMNLRLATALWETSDPVDRVKALYPFCVAEAPELLWTKLSELPSTERDHLLAYAIVQLLALESIRDASTLSACYKKSMAETGGVVNGSELLHFTDYLLQTVKRDAAPLFQTLVQSYGQVLDSYPHIISLVMGPIALKYFGLRPQSQPDMMSMLQTMLGGGGGGF